MSSLTPLARLAQLEEQLRDDYAEAARRLWSIGNSLLEVRRDELWRLAGHASFELWLRVAGTVGKTSAYKAMQVAEQFSGDTAARHGTEKLIAASRYLNATKQMEAPGDLDALQIRTRAQDGSWTTVPFGRASAATILDAARLVSEVQTKRQVPKEIRSRVSKLAATLPGGGPGRNKAGRVTLARTRDGKVVATFNTVPLDDLPAFVAALQAWMAAGQQG